MITIIITAVITAAFSTTFILLAYHWRHGGKTESTNYTRGDDAGDDHLLFEEPVSYKATDVKNDILFKRLKETMEESKPFLNPNIRMNDIATAIGTNTSTLSSIINRRFNMSFTEMINSYRVKYAIEYIIKNPSVSSDTLKKECGFNTTSTFTNAFHRHTGMTPGEYLKKHKAKL